METASLDEAMNHERIRQSSNCLAMASLSFDSTQESMWTVCGSWNKWYSGNIADNMFDDDVISIYFDKNNCECEEEKIVTILT